MNSLENLKYEKPLSEVKQSWGENFDDMLMPLGEWMCLVKSRFLIDYDGYGSLVKDDMMAEGVNVWPSDWERIPAEVTHIFWYNK